MLCYHNFQDEIGYTLQNLNLSVWERRPKGRACSNIFIIIMNYIICIIKSISV